MKTLKKFLQVSAITVLALVALFSVLFTSVIFLAIFAH